MLNPGENVAMNEPQAYTSAVCASRSSILLQLYLKSFMRRSDRYGNASGADRDRSVPSWNTDSNEDCEGHAT